MKQMLRMALGDFRRLREDLKVKLSQLGGGRYLEIDSGPASGGTGPLVVAMEHAPPRLRVPYDRDAEVSSPDRLANPLVGSSIRLASTRRVNRNQPDCRGQDAGTRECGQRLSPPCVAWGTATCRRSALGVTLAADHLSK